MLASVTLSLLEGFGITLKLFLLTLLFSLPLGLLFAFFLLPKNRTLSLLMDTFIWIIRGTPLMLQLIIIYYGPGIFLSRNIWGSGDEGRFLASLFAFVINYACYFAKIYQGGIASISNGQWEAGKVLGLSKGQIFVHIVFLQVIKRILEPLSNETITLVKDTSLARVVAVYEIIWSGQAYIRSSGIIWPLFYTGVFYLVFNGLLTVLFEKAVGRLSYFV